MLSRPRACAPRLAPPDLERLWRAWKQRADQNSRNQIVVSYQPMVQMLATRKARQIPLHVDIDDLVSAGTLGLLDAIDRWDPAKGAAFEHYAWTRISGAIGDELRRADWAPRSLRTASKSIDRARTRLVARGHSSPSEAELAAEAKMTVRDLHLHQEGVDRAQIISLNLTVEDAVDDAIALIDTLPDPDTNSRPEAATLYRDRLQLLVTVINTLPDRERTLISDVCLGDTTATEAARNLGISESRVSQLLKAARTRVRVRLATT
jgi:RNA polymerase sigma factor for flagellar operon FliA